MVIHLLSPQNNKSMKNTDDKKVDNEMYLIAIITMINTQVNKNIVV